ncbi:putative 2OG-Fe(II) oxygenase [Alteromonas genovensis]|uniref:putative 2OG-Fe(II) oxygenase n=1 Tax=Alteromonas genovensis TaxID=471225 RepID=UPI002FE1EDA3
MYDLQKTLSLHQEGKLDIAAKSYQALLAKTPNDINVNFLYGKLLNDTQQPKRAEALLRKAYNAVSTNVSILTEYAKCMLSLGKGEDVIDLLSNHCKTSEELSKLFLKAQHLVCNTAELTEHYHQQLSYWNDSSSLMLTMAQLCDDRGELTASCDIYLKILNKDPNNVLALHNLATIKRRLEMPNDALVLLERAQTLGLDSFQLHHNLGNAFSDLNDIDSAIAAYSKAISLNPYYIDSYKNLAALYSELGEIGSAIALYENAISANKLSKDIILELIRSYLRVGNTEKAILLISKYFSASKGSSKDSVDLYDNDEDIALVNAEIKYLENDITGAFETLFDTLKDIKSDKVVLQCAKYAIQTNNTSFVLEHMPELTNKRDSAVMAKAYLTLAERLSGQNAHRQSYCHYESLVKTFELPDTISHDGAADFCKKLSAYLSTQHTATSAPLQQTLNGGTQTRGNIFSQSDNKLIGCLKAFCEQSIKDYISELDRVAQPHPYLPALSNDIKFVGAWSVNLSNKGYHTNHVHPEGGLSAVFYVDIPNNLNETNEEGHLVFGKPNFDLPIDLTHEFSVMPKVGKLVVFPSYFWHGTIPFHSSEKRLTVAFDVSS